MDRLLAKYATRLLKLGVDEIEIKVRVDESGSKSITPVRLMASSMTGEFLRTDAFLEYADPVNGACLPACLRRRGLGGRRNRWATRSQAKHAHAHAHTHTHTHTH